MKVETKLKFQPLVICTVYASHLMSYCKSNKIGFIAWSWSGNDSGNLWLDMTNSL